VLRALVLLFAIVLVLGGLSLLVCGLVAPGSYALGFGGLLILGTAFERWRYRTNDSRPASGWEPTGERFEDPETGKPVQVYYNPQSGERRYVNDSEPAS
jgi:hypothetical protein